METSPLVRRAPVKMRRVRRAAAPTGVTNAASCDEAVGVRRHEHRQARRGDDAPVRVDNIRRRHLRAGTRAPSVPFHPLRSAPAPGSEVGTSSESYAWVETLVDMPDATLFVDISVGFDNRVRVTRRASDNAE